MHGMTVYTCTLYIVLLTRTWHSEYFRPEKRADMWPQIDETILSTYDFIPWNKKNKIRIMTWPWGSFLRWCRRWPSTMYAERNGDMTTGSLICRMFSQSVIHKSLLASVLMCNVHIRNTGRVQSRQTTPKSK